MRSLSSLPLTAASGILAVVLTGCGGRGTPAPPVPLPVSGTSVPTVSRLPLYTSETAPGARQKPHPRYILEDLGTFGGPSSGTGESQPFMLLDGGFAAGWADTSRVDPYAPNCLFVSCHVGKAFLWDGRLHNLGSLAGHLSSSAEAINVWQDVSGFSQTGVIDPISGLPEWRGVLWSEGRRVRIGTFGGNNSAVFDMSRDVRQQMAGLATNSVYDAYGLVFPGQQNRAFYWRDGRKRDIGTLGGPDAFAQLINDRGQIAGFSYINNTPGSSGVPTVDPFFWDPNIGKHGRMYDIGSFGGTFGQVWGMNRRGQVIGQSNGTGDSSVYPFLWHHGKLTKLPTFGGFYGLPHWINDAGEVVGFAFGSDPMVFSPALWKDGTIKNLGVLPNERCGSAESINNHGQAVGISFRMSRKSVPCNYPDPKERATDAVLWENGSVINLNSVTNGSSLHLVVAAEIDDAGDISGLGVPPGVPVRDHETKGHVFVLIPCDGERARDRRCMEPSLSAHAYAASNMEDASGPGTSRSARWLVPVRGLAAIRAALARRYHLFGLSPRSL